MNKKTSLKPNAFDLLIVVLLVLLAATAFLLTHGDSLFGPKPVKRTYLIELAGLEPGMAENIHIGDQVLDNVRQKDLGTIIDMEVVPTLTSVFDETSDIVRQAAADYENTVNLTIEVDTVEDDEYIQTPDDYILKVGKDISVLVNGVLGTGYILAVERLEDAA